MKLFNRALVTVGWIIFLFVSSLLVMVLFEKPRSVAEFYASLIGIDTFYLLLAVIGCSIFATVITILGKQES